MNEGTILLVDDSPDDVALMLRALRVNNISNRVDVVSDGEEALRYLLPKGTGVSSPALLLLDINLPKVSGLEVLRVVRAHEKTQHLPVVMLSTSSEDRDIVESYNLGANSYVRKPVIFTEFVEAVRVVGVYWLLVNQPAMTRNGGQPT
jgi:two-component system response regulator